MRETGGPSCTRREWLTQATGGLGAIALAGLLAESSGAEGTSPADSLAPRPPHHEPRARRVIVLYMTGGVSHVDTFDPKPRLVADHGKSITVDNWQGKRGQFPRFFKRPNWEFRPGGRCGTEISDLFPHVRD